MGVAYSMHGIDEICLHQGLEGPFCFHLYPSG